QLNADHCGNQFSPRPGSVDDDRRGDVAARGADACDAALINVNAGDFGVEPDARAAFFGALRETDHDAVGINKAISWAEAAAENVIADDLRNDADNIIAAHRLHVSQPVRRLNPPVV